MISIAMKNLIVVALMLISAGAHAEINSNFLDKDKDPEAYCLALNVYYEARGSSLADQAAVADVVINRMHDDRYPDTMCAVVQQGEQHANGQMKRHRCQFSWYCDGKADVPRNGDAWARAQYVAYNMIYMETFRGITEGATHYHANYVEPGWAKTLTLVGQIGSHIFYRWN